MKIFYLILLTLLPGFAADNIRISELPTQSTPSRSGAYFPMSQGGTTYKVSIAAATADKLSTNAVVTDAQVPNNITVDLASAANALLGPLTNGALKGMSVRDDQTDWAIANLTSASTVVVNWTNASYFLSLAHNATVVWENLPTSATRERELRITVTNTAAFAITWPVDVQWPPGTNAPTLPATSTSEYLFKWNRTNVNGYMDRSTITAEQLGPGLLSVATGGVATFVVAASDAPTRIKAQADYVCDGTADDVQIQAAIDSSPGNGAIIYLTQGNFNIAATITIRDKQFVRLIGSGAEHALYSAVPTNGTVLKWTGATNGIMMQVGATVASARSTFGNAVEGMAFDANTLAAYGLQVISSWHGRYIDLHIHNAKTVGLLTTSVDLTNTEDTQGCTFQDITVTAVSTFAQNCIGIFCTSGAVGIGNTSGCTFENIQIYHRDGVGWMWGDTDTNTGEQIMVNLFTGGTGVGITFEGSATGGLGHARRNALINVQPVSGLTAKGTALTQPSGPNWILYEFGNSAPTPVIETGASLYGTSTQGSYPVNNVYAIRGRNAAGTGDVNMWKINTIDELMTETLLRIGNHTTIADTKNIVVSASTGTKIGTGTTQKLGLWNATPIAQPSSTSDLKDAMTSFGSLASGGATPLNLDNGGFTGSTLFLTNTADTFVNYASDAFENQSLLLTKKDSGNSTTFPAGSQLYYELTDPNTGAGGLAVGSAASLDFTQAGSSLGYAFVTAAINQLFVRGLGTKGVGTSYGTLSEIYVSTNFGDLNMVGGSVTFTGTANVSNVFGFRNAVNLAADTVVGSIVGVYIPNPGSSPGAIVTNNYGILIDDLAVGNTNYAIRTGTGNVWHKDKVTIGTNGLRSTTSILDVQGTITADNIELSAPQNVVNLYEDYLAVTVGQFGWASTLVTAITGTAAHPGLVQLATGVATNGIASMRNTGTSVLFSGGRHRFSTSIRIPTLSDGTESFTLFVGFLDTGATAGEGSDGAYFIYSSDATYYANVNNWSAKTANAAARTVVNSATAVVAGQFYTLAIDVNAAGTAVEFFIDGVSIGTSTTNIPIATGRETGMNYKLEKQVGTTTRTMDIDYTWYTFKPTTPR